MISSQTKTFFGVMLILLSGSVFGYSKSSINVVGGLSRSTTIIKGYSLNNYRVSFAGGLQYSYQMLNRISIESGISIITKGDKSAKQTNTYQEAGIRLTYLEIPILLSARVFERKSLIVRVLVGAGHAQLLNAIYYEIDDNVTKEYDMIDDVASSESVGILGIRVSNDNLKGHPSFELRVAQGMKNILPDSQPEEHFNLTFSLLLGYKLW